MVLIRLREEGRSRRGDRWLRSWAAPVEPQGPREARRLIAPVGISVERRYAKPYLASREPVRGWDPDVRHAPPRLPPRPLDTNVQTSATDTTGGTADLFACRAGHPDACFPRACSPLATPIGMAEFSGRQDRNTHGIRNRPTHHGLAQGSTALPGTMPTTRLPQPDALGRPTTPRTRPRHHQMWATSMSEGAWSGKSARQTSHPGSSIDRCGRAQDRPPPDSDAEAP